LRTVLSNEDRQVPLWLYAAGSGATRELCHIAIEPGSSVMRRGRAGIGADVRAIDAPRVDDDARRCSTAARCRAWNDSVETLYAARSSTSARADGEPFRP